MESKTPVPSATTQPSEDEEKEKKVEGKKKPGRKKKQGEKPKSKKRPRAHKAQKEKESVKTPEKKEGGMGKDIQELGEQVVKRVDSIVRKKGFEFMGDPWLFQGIPLVFPSSASGFNIGFHTQFEDVSRQDPHAFSLDAQVLASDEGRYKHGLYVDIPHALDGEFRIKAGVRYDRDFNFLYYGIGNNTPYDPGAGPFVQAYENIRAGPGISFEMLRYMGGHVRMGPVAGLRWTDISTPPGSLLQQQNPTGVTGGRTHYIGFAIIYDTRDFEPYPTRGSVHEFYFNLYSKFTGSSYDFMRFTYTYLRFIPLGRHLVLAHRTLLEPMTGDVPYYELGAVGGSNPAMGFGGDRF